MRVDLSRVTLVAIDTVCHELTRMAINECTDKASFGDIKIFSDKSIFNDTIKIEPITNIQDAIRVAHYEMPDYINTDFVLMVQWDAWILDTSVWKLEYLDYDYIGAPWWRNDEFNVGNSGFCLRSTNLLKYLAKNRDKFPVIPPEDDTLCRKYRPQLPQFKWAPQKLAQDFAFERVRPAIDSRHFGYHGMFNWPFILSYEGLIERLQIAKKILYLQKNGMLKELDRLWYGIWGHNQQIKRNV